MAIRYYPNRIYRAASPAIDKMMSIRKLQDPIKGYKDIIAAGLDVTVSSDSDWRVNSVAFEFSGATDRDYSVVIKNGRKVIKNINDYMWIYVDGLGNKIVTLTPGFYTGTELAAELQTQLDTVFNPVTFTVVYDDTTGLFAITPIAGNIKYINVRPTITLSKRDSICGHLFGFEVDSVLAASITSDTPVFGLDAEATIINEESSAALSHYHDDVHELSVDQALALRSGTAAISLNYTIVYEKSINGQPYIH